jgi:hypothetical protein
MLIDFGPGSRQLFTATVNQKETYGLPTILPELGVVRLAFAQRAR